MMIALKKALAKIAKSRDSGKLAFTLIRIIRLVGYKGLKWYSVFAALHVCYKLFTFLKMRLVQEIKWRHLPKIRFSFFGREVSDNMHRFHIWRQEKLSKFEGQDLVAIMGARPEVVCNTPESIKVMLQSSFNTVTKPNPKTDYLFSILVRFLGKHSIFSLRHGKLSPELAKEHKEWFDERKTASMIFTKSNYNNFIFESILDKSSNLLKEIEKCAKTNPDMGKDASNAELHTMEIQNRFFSLTFDIIQKIFFNRDVNSVEGTPDEYAVRFDSALRSLVQHTILSIPAIVVFMVLLPYPFGSLKIRQTNLGKFYDIYRENFSEDYKIFQRDSKYVRDSTMEFVREVRKDTNELDKRRDLLANFVKNSSKWSDEQLCDIIISFTLAGRDTTASAITWLFFELTQNLDVQSKLAQEIYDKFGSDTIPGIDQLSRENLPYLHACMLEALRLHPPVPEDNKVTSAPTTFPCGTVIEKDTILLFSPYSMGRNKKLFSEPFKFNPDRWLGNRDYTETPLDDGMYKMPVFQGGSRYCIGMQLAKTELKLIVIRILQKYHFELDPKQDPEKISGMVSITMSLSNDGGLSSTELNVVPRRRVW